MAFSLSTFLKFVQPSKNILYDVKLTAEEIQNIVAQKHENAATKNFFELAFDNSYDYEFESENKIRVKPTNNEGGYDTAAVVEIIKNSFGETILNVTYYKPFLISIWLTAFLTISIIAKFWWAGLLVFSIGHITNYFIFLKDWRNVESSITRTFQIEK